MIWLIDGHNLIGKMPGLRLDDPDDERKLLYQLHLFAQRARRRLTVVFDPGLLYVPPHKSPYADVKVHYARAGQTADRVILNMLRAAARPREITVVTSDRGLGNAARDLGAQVLSSEEFLAGMQPAPTAEDEAEDAARADVHLSAGEVEAWLEEFRRAKRRRH
jgi:predicted RNA-binding protein with PIN domain